MIAPVTRLVTVATAIISRGRHTVNPYSRHSPIQMRWNGIVSWPGSSSIAATQAADPSSHASRGSRLARGEAVSDMAHRLDPVGVVQLGPQPAHVHVHHVA